MKQSYCFMTVELFYLILSVSLRLYIFMTNLLHIFLKFNYFYLPNILVGLLYKGDKEGII